MIESGEDDGPSGEKINTNQKWPLVATQDSRETFRQQPTWGCRDLHLYLTWETPTHSGSFWPNVAQIYMSMDESVGGVFFFGLRCCRCFFEKASHYRVAQKLIQPRKNSAARVEMDDGDGDDDDAIMINWVCDC